MTRQSQDTRDLIKVGWERMLPAPAPAPAHGESTQADEYFDQIAAGLAAEIRADLGLTESESQGQQPTGDQLVELNQAVDQLRETVEAQLHATAGTPSDEVQFWVNLVEGLSSGAKVLALAVQRAHITRNQLRRLQRDPEIGQAASELRRAGLLVPLEGFDRERKETVVYWFPPGKVRYVRAALTLLPEPPPVLKELVQTKLDARWDIPTGPRRQRHKLRTRRRSVLSQRRVSLARGWERLDRRRSLLQRTVCRSPWRWPLVTACAHEGYRWVARGCHCGAQR